MSLGNEFEKLYWKLLHFKENPQGVEFLSEICVILCKDETFTIENLLVSIINDNEHVEFIDLQDYLNSIHRVFAKDVYNQDPKN